MGLINFPADGFGVQSPYYDDDLLLDGTYEVVSVTLHKDSRDYGNLPTTTLRAGLLLAKRSDALYEPLSTVDGGLNGDTPTQFIQDVVVLGREVDLTTILVKGVPKYMSPHDRTVPAYWSCNLFANKWFYNNKEFVELTRAQLVTISRLRMVPAGMVLHRVNYGYLRNISGVQNVATI